jgi:hypothetical protein
MANGTSSPGTRSEKPRRGRKTIARKLFAAAGVLPKKVRDELRDYLIEHGDIEPRRRKVHSWKRKRKPKGRLVSPRSFGKSKPRKVNNQIPLAFD